MRGSLRLYLEFGLAYAALTALRLALHAAGARITDLDAALILLTAALAGALALWRAAGRATQQLSFWHGLVTAGVLAAAAVALGATEMAYVSGELTAALPWTMLRAWDPSIVAWLEADIRRVFAAVLLVHALFFNTLMTLIGGVIRPYESVVEDRNALLRAWAAEIRRDREAGRPHARPLRAARPEPEAEDAAEPPKARGARLDALRGRVG